MEKIYDVFMDHYEIVKNDPQSIIMQRAMQIRLKSPLFVTWEITSKCNLSCVHCRAAYNNSRNKNEMLPFEAYAKTLHKFNQLEIYTLGITGGEPFVHPLFWEILRESRKYLYNIILYTNGTYIDEVAASNLSRILGTNDIVHVSLDGGTEESNDRQRGKGCFKKTLNALSLLKKYNVPVRLNIVPTIYNVSSIPELCHIAMEMNVKEFGASPIMLMGRANEKKMIPDQSVLFDMELKAVSILKNSNTKYIGGISGPVHAYLDIQEWNNNYDEKRICLPYKWCDAGNRKIFVDAIGDVYPCSLFATNSEFLVGNIFKDNFDCIWNSNILLELGSGIRISEPLCLNCKMLSLCNGGCMALSYNHYGNLGAMDPRCKRALEKE